MAQTAFQCTKCSAMWTRRTLLEDACPQCEGEVVDITNTPNGQVFLSIVETPVELRSTSLGNQMVYTTGPSSLFSIHARGNGGA